MVCWWVVEWWWRLHFRRCSLFVTDFWRQVIFEDTKIVNLVLNHQGLLIMQAQTCEGRKRCCLIEHIEIPDGELLSHGLSNFQSSALIGGTRLVVSKLDAAWSRLWLDRESDKLGTCWNGKSLVEWVELFANLSKLTRVNRNKWAVLSFWDG